MKKKSQLFSSLLVTAALFSTGCSFTLSNWEYNKAERAEKKSDYGAAVKHYNRVVIRDPESDIAMESARKASRLALFQLRDFDKAIELFRYIVKFSPEITEVKSAQREIADIAFEKKTDYKMSVAEYNKLLSLKLPKEEFLDIKLRIAKAHYYMSEFFQSESEVTNALIKADKGPQRFELELFLANIYFNTKRLDKAVEAYKKLVEEYPDLAANEKVQMSLVVSYEESEKFNEAIDLLENMKETADDPSFLDLKISRLKERIRNLPGARGMRK